MIPTRNPFTLKSDIFLHTGDCINLLKQIPDEAVNLVITSPPYNLGKEYEKRIPLRDYLKWQKKVIAECVRILAKKGSICWQVGNYIQRGEVFPLDMLLYPEFKKHGLILKNRIIWHFNAGLPCWKRFSGRHESILWFTKSYDYVFNLDPVRIPQKYPLKRYSKGTKKGQLSGNPLGKNPGDTWHIKNVQNVHPEKTEHPCQFPVALVERLILALTNPGDLVVDPFIGSGSTAVAAIINSRRCAGADKIPKYIDIAKYRIKLAREGILRVRPISRLSKQQNKSDKDFRLGIC